MGSTLAAWYVTVMMERWGTAANLPNHYLCRTMFEAITERLTETFRALSGKARLTEANIADAVKEVRRALLEADVNYKIAKDFTDRVKEIAIGQEVIRSVTPTQLFVKILYDELVRLLGEKQEPLRFAPITADYLYDSRAKWGWEDDFFCEACVYLKSQGKAPFLIAADVYRPAAAEQLAVLAEKVEVPIYREDGTTDVEGLIRRGIEAAKKQAREVIIIDTAGRQTPDTDLMEELAQIAKAFQPTEVLLVLDAMTGQDAVTTSQAFTQTVPVTGFILSKLDGDARGELPFPYGPPPASLSSLSVPVKSPKTSRPSIPTALPAESWAWAISSLSWKKPRLSLTPSRQLSSRKNSKKISLTWKTC
jgi:signal recognition particle subunit SRP54